MPTKGINIALTSKLDDIADNLLPNEIEDRMLKSAVELHGHVIESLSGSRSGREYQVPGTKRTYRASAPGESPAVMMGDLRTEYRFLVDGKGYDSMGVVGNPLDYAVFLEKGTRRMRPRPHLRRSYIENHTKIMRFFEGLIK